MDEYEQKLFEDLKKVLADITNTLRAMTQNTKVEGSFNYE